MRRTSQEKSACLTPIFLSGDGGGWALIDFQTKARGLADRTDQFG